MASDWNLYTTISRDYISYNDRNFLPNDGNELDCVCVCDINNLCLSAVSTTQLCTSLLENTNVTRVETCSVYAASTLLDKTGNQCTYRWSEGHFLAEVDDLLNVRWACLAINLITLPFCALYMLYLLRQLRRHGDVDDKNEIAMEANPIANPHAAVTRQPTPHVRFCSNGHTMTMEAQFCPQCGAQSHEARETATEEATKAELATAQFKVRITLGAEPLILLLSTCMCMCRRLCACCT
jgi:hypothetical protein